MNRYPIAYLDSPITGEVFSSIDDYHSRLIAYSLSQGFNIVKTHSATRPTPGYTFAYVFHGEETRNTRRLKRTIERNKEGDITSNRQRNLTSVRQTGY